MAATDEFPRGLTQTATATDAACTITFPAAAGIAWVLSDLNWTMASANGQNYFTQLTVNGTQFLFQGEDSAGGYSSNASWSGTLAFPVNTAVTITASLAAVAIAHLLTATACPI